MVDLHKIGGTPAVMKHLLKKGYLHGDILTVTTKKLAENLENLPELSPDQNIIFTENPIQKVGHIKILRGNLAPEGAVAKITGKEGQNFTGTAKVFDREEKLLEALEKK